ncbi:MAG TPA: YdcF family protein [Slackia equolifaciens]|uniref:YdcF family protein n=1 Tax=Slackia equolifaciens TaxID=498718 RepID=A0A9D2UVM1_9ACTN|nr:YdcF family protein [Slackia equolifaciens]
MAEWILVALGVACVAYGFAIFAVGSGTMFFAVWFAIAALFFGAAAGVHFDWIAKAPLAVRWAGGVALAAVLAVGVVESGLIATGFNAAGRPGLDYLVVLGAQVKADGPSVVLRYRLDAAATYLQENPTTRCIVTGAQGYNEPCTEAEGMRDYLVAVGIDESRIILEPQARNTQQNISYSLALMDSPDCSVGIVTNNFHVFRGTALAKSQGMTNACGIAAPSNPLYLPNNILREYFGITKDIAAGNIKVLP